MTFDDLIAQGIRDTLEEKCAEYRLDGKEHHFSIAYKIRRESIIHSRRKKAPISVRKIKYILLAIILSLVALTGFSLWRHFGSFSFNVFNDHSRVYYGDETVKTSIEEIYGLPEEYELLGIYTYEFNVLSQYLFDGEIITLSQHLINHLENINTEQNSAVHLTIKGNDGYYINNVADNNYYIEWVMDGYRFYLHGNIDKNTAVILAESLEIRNFDKIP